MALVTLFDQSSVSPTSRFFYIDHQITIVAIGMPAEDFITFEVVESKAAAMPRNCGCDLIPSGQIALSSVQELNCPSCISNPRPVTVTSVNPVAILDNPQGFFIRAIYNGNGLQDGTVTVRAFDSDTSDVTPEMRGCPPVCCEDTEERTWEPTGVFRCNLDDETYEERERSNCGDFRWTVVEALRWEATAETRCAGANIETRYTNQCGDSDWRVSGTTTWQETASTRCNGTNIESLYENDCGQSEWRVTGTVTWSDTGVTRCSGTNVESQQVNQCGHVRWVVTGTPVWHETANTRCNGVDIESLFENECGQSEWRVTGTVTWNDTGVTRCVGGNVEAQQSNQCGDVRWESRGAPVWRDTPNTRCNNGVVEIFQQNECGATRWFDTGTSCETYIATLDLFCGARAFRPTDPRDPAATVPLQGCCDDDAVIGYIYPTPRLGATTAVTAGECDVCEDNVVIGYAVDWPNGLSCCSTSCA